LNSKGFEMKPHDEFIIPYGQWEGYTGEIMTVCRDYYTVWLVCAHRCLPDGTIVPLSNGERIVFVERKAEG